MRSSRDRSDARKDKRRVPQQPDVRLSSAGLAASETEVAAVAGMVAPRLLLIAAAILDSDRHLVDHPFDIEPGFAHRRSPRLGEKTVFAGAVRGNTARRGRERDEGAAG